ncbi:zinc finger MYM-type 1-like [Pelobates cultripes]|uniref:Zinc finger MYM-type 1-like n=1 Tax=Pelobates cultripes TaxID=61616 RepID=A0AAD1RV73_PELCU|nr:zinc finger MYM-type 1-like [Pelobates cultripes]
MFLIHVVTTQDITSKDQCSVIVRYVKECIKEKLLAVVECKSSTGQNLFKLVLEVLKSCKLDITKCIGSSMDGAANMPGQYNGFSSWMSPESPGQDHIWCYAHILNLVLADTTKVVVASASLFSLLYDIAVFIHDSYKRMNNWEEVSQDHHHWRISVIGETRWWSKDAAIRKVFGEFSNSDSAEDVVVCDAISAYKINVHNVILDMVTESISRRFLACGTLFADLACSEPNNFHEIKKCGLQEFSLLLVKFDEGATSENLHSQLANFALRWETSHLEEYRTIEDIHIEDQESNLADTELVNKSCKACKNCYLVLSDSTTLEIID